MLDDVPDPRPHETRSTVRVLLTDDAGRLLLFRDSDPGTDLSWWMTPGGGIDPGEGPLDAVVRELAEETGLDVDPAAVRGPLAHRRVLHGYTDRIVEQADAFYAVRVPAFEVSIAGHTEEEQETLLDHRWWEPADLRAALEAGDEIWPAVVLDLLALAEQPDRLQEWPLALPDVEESSVPVGT